MSGPQRNLVLVHSRSWQDIADFRAIKAHIDWIAPDIEVFIASNYIRSSVTRKLASARPSLIFSPIRLLQFSPARGKVYAGKPMSKIDEMTRLAAAGIPVPAFEVIGPETRLSETDYGPVVIVKPSYDLSSFGQGIELRRTRTVQYRAPKDFPDGHPGRKGPMIAQRFIDCGYPMTCRVLTIFGRPIFTYCRQSTKPFALASGRDSFNQDEFMPASPHRTVFTTRDPDILALAEAAYRALPEVALQACDIVREKETGKLYLLEVNPGGGTWMFSNSNAAGYREALGITDLAAEFDAFRTIAEALVEHTRAEAS